MLPMAGNEHRVRANASRQRLVAHGHAACKCLQYCARPGQPLTLYTLSTEGIYRSSDSGSTWSLCGRDARFMRLVPPVKDQGAPITLYTGTPTTLYTTGPS